MTPPDEFSQFPITSKETAGAIQAMKDGTLVPGQRLILEGISVPSGQSDTKHAGAKYNSRGENYLRNMFSDVLLMYHMETTDPISKRVLKSEPKLVPFTNTPIITLPTMAISISGLDIYATEFHLTESMDICFRHGISSQTAEEVLANHQKRHVQRTVFHEYGCNKAEREKFASMMTWLKKESLFFVEAQGISRARAIVVGKGLGLAKAKCNLTLFAKTMLAPPTVKAHESVIALFLACEYITPEEGTKIVEPSWIAEVEFGIKDGSFGYFASIFDRKFERGWGTKAIGTAPPAFVAIEEFLRMVQYERALNVHGDLHICSKCGYMFQISDMPGVSPVPPKFCGPWLIRDRFCPHCYTTSETELLLDIYRGDFQDCFANLIENFWKLPATS